MKFKKIFLYLIFAGVAITLNIIFQRIIFILYNGSNTIFVAIIGGSFVSLAAKYFLDRTFIFSVQAAPQTGNFLRYAFTGGLITLIYFVVEYLIWTNYRTEVARDLGIVIGMIAGYGVKYIIDREFVFNER